ncbi:uncharacterized protein LOC106873229 isoform X2 [Octopus bimaculoides]|uniref:Uncharacterized protein n=1 Tax=Octopus bimaculoides TaxID=37653 RepID=A0A0L8H3P3_OCTBM|nr:uncharacterized protein LOC106873229 isoform X2 [Octopus bimaculoides]|eukprot:XP_014775987.1 PREDICTED: uncharacterized protein LOC106873229 isoform X2 [Octopus bimaculoides]
MSLLYCWSILIFICLHFANIQATIWKVSVLLKVHCDNISITLNNRNKSIGSRELRSIEFELASGENPNSLCVNPDCRYNATVEREGHQEKYTVECQTTCCKKFKTWTQWNLEVIRSDINDNYIYSFEIKHYREKINFETNSRTSNKSFFLPMEINKKSKIDVLTPGKFWSDTVVKLKNMKTSSIFSCIYVLKKSTFYHECFLTNNSVWRIDLTQASSKQTNIKKITKSHFKVHASEGYHHLTFKRLTNLHIFSAVTSIRNISSDVVKVSFTDSKNSIDISKIVMTRMLTGEEYGCVNINKEKSLEYSCKVLKSKNWLLKVISSEKRTQKFAIEIVQDKLSSVSRNLTWSHFCQYGDIYIKHFNNLKTYEDDEITSLKVHFIGKSLKINEISLINNFTEYKFKTNEGSKTQDNLVTEFIRMTKGKEEKMYFMKLSLIMTIVIVLLAVIIVFLIIISIVALRCKMTRNKNICKGNTSTLKISASQESGCVLLKSEETYSNMNPSLKWSPGIYESEGYWGL